MIINVNKLTLEAVKSLREDIETLKNNLNTKVPQNNTSVFGSTQITLETALKNIAEGKEGAENIRYEIGNLKSFFDSLSKSGIEFKNTTLIGNLLNKQNIKISKTIQWYLETNIAFLNTFEQQKIANKQASEKEVSEFFSNLGEIADENQANHIKAQNEAKLKVGKIGPLNLTDGFNDVSNGLGINQLYSLYGQNLSSLKEESKNFGQDAISAINKLEIHNKFHNNLSSLNGKFSNEDIAKIYNTYGKDRGVILSAIDDLKLKDDFTKVFETLDKKAETNVNQEKFIKEETIKNLTPGVLDSIKDTLKAVANFFVKVFTIGYKQGFNRSDYETKTNYQSSIKRIEKSVQVKSHVQHAQNKGNGNDIAK